ncbi:DUF3052 domain-containing protein [Nocardioides psychrotolerans]|uniref:DUF3052 domain-containing protein n=1 Tax=Nocardioides psychrotolerans TaxID=1005945 RepID=A0A1I3HIP9_9ACTN|nr:hypothetical protein [Nocardioides psychrotolerans]GEP39988.1 DUF3052 domain-containing protein [Nocardioides psychrotolerans]SFI35562.1 hypothetical protein SAMN05216561_107201 [Nocardioides psychrotolerans]
MTSRTVAMKMGIKPAWRTHVVGAPDGVLETLGLPPLEMVPELTGDFDYLHLFVTAQAAMRVEFPRLVPHLASQGKLWLSWPKARKLGSDLNVPKVIEIGYDCGLVESTCLRIDETWTALRFTHPKIGKVYENSYGTLPTQRA